ncbi:methyltransferase family protein [Burkholderiales bacterium JOSHI_001]|nr:methyltransferase family protein [Burkholderiales bacterium JOSHI_001]
MDLTAYRNSVPEQQRVADLMARVPADVRTVLDIGTRDGHLARLLADRGLRVTALDLELPQIGDPRIECVQGDASALAFADSQFDLVLCAEVLEHVPTAVLARACQEMARVAGRWVLIGVPNRQDLRMARTTCSRCGGVNPPWGHVNCFDERSLRALFSDLVPSQMGHVGTTRDGTNALSAALMNWAGNPFGTYEQDEPCVHCGQPLGAPAGRSPLQRVATRVAVLTDRLQDRFRPERGNWLHMLFERPVASN